MSKTAAKVYPDVEGGEGAGFPTLTVSPPGAKFGRLDDWGLNDTISFIEVNDGYAVTLYKHSRRRGKKLRIQGPAKVNLHNKGMADKVSSIKAEKSKPPTKKAAQSVKSLVGRLSEEEKQLLFLAGGALLLLWVIK